MPKPKMIVLEGISGSGKTSLLHPINALSNYRDPVLMRFTPSCWVYNKLYGRDEVDYEPLNQSIMAEHELHIVFLQCDPTVAYRRQVQKKDKYTEDLHAAEQLFFQYFREVTSIPSNRIHSVKTDVPSQSEVVDWINARVYGA